MTKLESVLSQALELDEDERLFLAMQLDASVPKDSEGARERQYEEAWSVEIKRRLDEIDRGEGDFMDWEDFRKEITATE